MHSRLPGEPLRWRDFRAALRNLMARTETTALAVERLSNDPSAKQRGATSISDSTVGRKIADNDDPVDARSVRTIVLTCELAAERRGRPSTDADVELWLRVRIGLAEGVAESSAEPAALESGPRPGSRSRPRRIALIAVVAAVLLVSAGVAGWTLSRPDPSGPGPVVAASVDDLTSGQAPCRNPEDQPAGTGLAITAPASGTVLTSDSVEARGTVDLAAGERPPWLLLYAVGECKFYLETPVIVSGRTWAGTLYFDPTQTGAFVAYAMVVDAATDRRLYDLTAVSRSPFLLRLPPGARVVHVTVRCCA